MITADERRSALARLVDTKVVTRVTPPILVPALPFFELAGEEFGRRLLLTTAADGVEYCLRPDFTLPIAAAYLREGLAGTPASYGYLGTVFRQRASGPAEFDQAGLELLCQPEPHEALDQVITFARWALGIYGINTPTIRLGGVDLFERFLAGLDMPEVWRPRLRHRFGNADAMNRLLDRLSNPVDSLGSEQPIDRVELEEFISESMFLAGLNPQSGRSPKEIADRYYEKATLATARASKDVLTVLRDYLKIRGKAGPAIDQVEALANTVGIDLVEPLTTMRHHVAGMRALAPKSRLLFDAAFSPQLDYYTGIVFEMMGEGRTVLASGGQYDKLLLRLGSDKPISASGCAVWVDRLERESEL
jgi:ATP phosphoribosyltransferase regulatory subunit